MGPGPALLGVASSRGSTPHRTVSVRALGASPAPGLDGRLQVKRARKAAGRVCLREQLRV